MSRPTPGRAATTQYPRSAAQGDSSSRSRSTGTDPKPQVFTPPPGEEQRHKNDIARRNWKDPTSTNDSFRAARPNTGGSAGRWHVEEVLAEEFPGLEQQLKQLGTIKPDLVKRYRDVSALPKRDYTTAIRDMLPKLGSDATENPQWDEEKADAAREVLIASVCEVASKVQEAFKAHFEAGSKTGDTGESKTEQQQSSAGPDERSGTNDTRSDKQRTNTAADDERMRKNEEDGDRRAEEARNRHQRQAREQAEQKEKEQRQGRTSGNPPHTGGSTSSFPGSPPPFGSFGSGFPVSPSSFSSAGSASSTHAAWQTYEKAWKELRCIPKDAKATLRWRDIPWPMVAQPSQSEDLVEGAIANFVLSPTHSESKSPKERIREALLRWHPDQFRGRWLPKCVEEDREEIKEGADSVVRCLNEILSAIELISPP